MFKKDIYKYKDEKGRTVISPYKPNAEYEHMYRLIAQSNEYRLTNYSIVTQVVDIQEKDLELWFEVHKDDLETPISQLEQINTNMQSLAKIGSPILSDEGFPSSPFYTSNTITLKIYVEDASNPPTFTKLPWGATNATITYEQA